MKTIDKKILSAKEKIKALKMDIADDRKDIKQIKKCIKHSKKLIAKCEQKIIDLKNEEKYFNSVSVSVSDLKEKIQ